MPPPPQPGAERVAVGWVNAIDGQSPPPFVYLARCVGADVEPDWPMAGARRRCSAKRSLTRHACRVGIKLQVFLHRGKGWCLRTLAPIGKGDRVMEYVGERCTAGGGGGGERKRRWEWSHTNMVSYEDEQDNMVSYEDEQDTSAQTVYIDGTHARSVAGFAAFACRADVANMKRDMWLGEHRDQSVRHVVFSATKVALALALAPALALTPTPNPYPDPNQGRGRGRRADLYAA